MDLWFLHKIGKRLLLFYIFFIYLKKKNIKIDFISFIICMFCYTLIWLWLFCLYFSYYYGYFSRALTDSCPCLFFGGQAVW